MKNRGLSPRLSSTKSIVNSESKKFTAHDFDMETLLYINKIYRKDFDMFQYEMIKPDDFEYSMWMELDKDIRKHKKDMMNNR